MTLGPAGSEEGRFVYLWEERFRENEEVQSAWPTKGLVVGEENYKSPRWLSGIQVLRERDG